MGEGKEVRLDPQLLRERWAPWGWPGENAGHLEEGDRQVRAGTGVKDPGRPAQEAGPRLGDRVVRLTWFQGLGHQRG